jgi:hypothetical protein
MPWGHDFFAQQNSLQELEGLDISQHGEALQ